MKNPTTKKEAGQILVILALAIVAIFALPVWRLTATASTLPDVSTKVPQILLPWQEREQQHSI